MRTRKQYIYFSRMMQYALNFDEYLIRFNINPNIITIIQMNRAYVLKQSYRFNGSSMEQPKKNLNNE